MKQILILSIISMVFFTCTQEKKGTAKENYTNIITKYTEIKHIFSKEVEDTFYVYVRLPKNYSVNTTKRYPVLYLLDGDISFNMAISIVRYLQYGKDVPELIIVAPAYGTVISDKEINHRERDYTFSANDDFVESAGGERYLGFLEKELIPFVDSNYRTGPNRILNGFSLGGLFSVNILIRKPNLFNNYIVGSPYLSKDINFIKQKLTELNFTSPLKKFFVSVGELEEADKYQEPIKSIFDILKTKSGIKIKFTEFKDGTHYTSPAEALTYGLKFVFSDNV